VSADGWIIAHFASRTDGAVSLMTYAKQLFTAPMAILAQAAGAASMPFFASLWNQKRRYEFATGVADSVSRVVALSLLAGSGMVALAVPLVELLFTRGRFSVLDARTCAAYFAVFSLSLFLWSAQAIYSRAFYAAGNTFIPMAAGTIITLASLPIYAVLYRLYGAMGLAVASNLGILVQTVALALLLHRRRLVSLASLDYAELGRCLMTGLGSGAVAWILCAVMAAGLHRIAPGRIYLADIAELLAGGTIWLATATWVLEKSGSALPRVAMKRLGLG